MSATESTTDESTQRASLARAQYSRRNWWGESEEDSSGSGHSETSGTTKEESVSHLWLKNTTDYLFDPIALSEPTENGQHQREGVKVPLSDPELYPPSAKGRPKIEPTHMERKAPSTKQWRFSEEFGHVCFGGIIPDRPKDELLDLIQHVTENMQSIDVPPRNRREIRRRAKRMKESGDLHDTQIMRRVARWILRPDELEDNN